MCSVWSIQTPPIELNLSGNHTRIILNNWTIELNGTIDFRTIDFCRSKTAVENQKQVFRGSSYFGRTLFLFLTQKKTYVRLNSIFELSMSSNHYAGREVAKVVSSATGQFLEQKQF